MNKMLNRVGAYLLTIAMLVSCLMVTPAQAKTTTKYVTRAEVLSQVEKLIGATAQSTAIKKVKDVKKKDASYKTMSVALQAGLVKPNAKTQKLYPQKLATWDYVSGVVATVLEDEKANILGNKKASGKLTKKQLISFLDKQFPTVVKKNTKNVKKGNVIINKPNVSLRNVTITGNLVIGDGVADKEVTLENVTVKGRTIVRGGGVNSIILKGTTTLSTVIIRQVNNAVSLKVQGEAKVSMVYINDGSNDVKIVGNVGALTIQGSDLNVDLIGATVKELTVADVAENASVHVDDKSAVGNVNLNAEGARIDGAGKVETVNVNANKTIVTANTETVNVKEGVENPETSSSEVPSTKPSEPEKAEDNKNTDNNSSSGGNTDGSGSGGGSAGGSGSIGGSGSTDDGGSTGESGNTGDGGSTSGGGSTSDELNNAFAAGYPKIELNKSESTVTVTYKLKEGIASENNPVAIYNVIATTNTSYEPSAMAVFRGYCGTEDHPVWPNYVDYIGGITDDQEHSVEYSSQQIMANVSNGFELYSIVEQSGKISSIVDRVQLDKDTTESVVDNRAPHELYNGIYLNKAGNKVYIYFDEHLDNNSIPGQECFEFSSPVTISNIRIGEVNYVDGYVELELADSIQPDVTLSYTQPSEGNALQDCANIPNKVASFTQEVKEVTCEITNAYCSKDGTYLSVDITHIPIEVLGQNDSDRDKIGISADGVSYSLTDAHVQSFYSFPDEATFVVNNPNASAGTHSFSFFVKDGETLHNIAFDTYSLVQTTSFTEANDVTVSSANYNKSQKKLTIQLSDTMGGGNNWIIGSTFSVMVDNKEYIVRGSANRNWTQTQAGMVNDGIYFNPESLKHIDFSNASDVKIKYTMGSDKYTKILSCAGKPMLSTDYIAVSIEE